MAAIIPNICKSLRIQFLSRQRSLLLRNMSGKAISDCDESTDKITEASSDRDESTEICPDNEYNYPRNRMTAQQRQEFTDLFKLKPGIYKEGPDGRLVLVKETGENIIRVV